MLSSQHSSPGFQGPVETAWKRFSKRLFDVGFSVLLLIVFLPLLIFIALLIKITSAGPVLFRQERGGHHGRPFWVFKFRTMILEADALQDQLRSLNEMDGPVFKIKNDPRVTPLGKILRKTSLDEVPQLFNVLMGQMSLVGPRPLPTREALQCDSWQCKRMAVKPGLTCLWQVSGRNEVSFEEWMKMDAYYVENWSWRLDFKILLKTIPEVLCGHGR
jgi:exopolysaccharide biosynthesis polyprenyl glycosylphosphotransferase